MKTGKSIQQVFSNNWVFFCTGVVQFVTFVNPVKGNVSDSKLKGGPLEIYDGAPLLKVIFKSNRSYEKRQKLTPISQKFNEILSFKNLR